jgi:diguanylate cyclase (GGDEF)-like protein
MYCILVFTNDDHFSQRLERACDQRDDFELTVVDTVDAALRELSTREVSAVLVDGGAAELEAEERAQLLSAGGRIKAVFAAGSVEFDELNDSAHLGESDEAADLLDRMDKELAARSLSTGDRSNSEVYFSRDTQGRSYPDQSGGLDRHTSHFEADNKWTPNVLYVGADNEFRRELEQVSRNQVDNQQVGELMVFDEPHAVSLCAGAPSIDLVVLSVDGELSATWRLVRFLRRRQPEAPFEILLLTTSDSELPEGLGRTLGADDVLVHPVDPESIFERAALRTGGERSDMIVVCEHVQRAEMFASALSREPVDVTFISEVERLHDAFSARHPDLILLDGTSGKIDLEETVGRLQRDNPFAPTRYLASINPASINSASLDLANVEESPSIRRAFDGLLYAPVLPADIRQIVRLHLAQASVGRAVLERDRLTDVNSTLALGDNLQALLDEAARSGQSVVLTGVDVDDLGAINTRYGKDVGDSVLRSLADVLHQAAGARDAIYRTDADEFFILQNTDDERWPQMRERINRALHVFRQQTFRSADGRGTYATASAGSIVVPASGVSAEVCLQKCWVVLGRAAATNQDRVLVAQIDPSVFSGAKPSRDRSDEHS